MPGMVVAKFLSTGMKPLASRAMPSSLRPRVSVTGRRPTQTRTLSASSVPDSVWDFQLSWTLPFFSSKPCAAVLKRNLMPCFSRSFCERERHFVVAGREDAGHEFDDRHFRTEAAPDGAHFDADVAAADDDEFFGELGEGERFGRRDDVFAVEGEGGDLDRGAAGGDEDVLCGEGPRASARGCNFDFSSRFDRRGSLYVLDLVFLEEVADAGGVFLDDVFFELDHGGEIER